MYFYLFYLLCKMPNIVYRIFYSLTLLTGWIIEQLQTLPFESVLNNNVSYVPF